MQNPKSPLKITNDMTLDELAQIFQKQNYTLHYNRFRKRYIFYQARDLVYLRENTTTHFPVVYLRENTTTHFPVIGLYRGYNDDVEEIRPTHFNHGYVNYQGSSK